MAFPRGTLFLLLLLAMAVTFTVAHHQHEQQQEDEEEASSSSLSHDDDDEQLPGEEGPSRSYAVEEKIQFPKYIRLREPRMKATDIDLYSRYIKEHTLSPHAQAFCQAGRSLCNADYELPSSLVTSPSLEDASLLHLHRYFKKSEVLVNEKIVIPHLKNDVPFKAFLPQSISSKFPLNSEDRILSMLNIPRQSRLAKYMQHTIAKCQKPKKGLLNFWRKPTKTLCATSLEDMQRFIIQNVGSTDVESLQPTRFTFTKQKMTVKSITVMASPNYHHSVVCTDTIFPFSLFHCKAQKDVESIEVTLESEDNLIYFAVMQCAKVKWHLFNRHFLMHNKEAHPDDKLCHWMTDNDVVFVKKDKEMEREEERQVKQEEKKDDKNKMKGLEEKEVKHLKKIKQEKEEEEENKMKGMEEKKVKRLGKVKQEKKVKEKETEEEEEQAEVMHEDDDYEEKDEEEKDDEEYKHVKDKQKEEEEKNIDEMQKTATQDSEPKTKDMETEKKEDDKKEDIEDGEYEEKKRRESEKTDDEKKEDEDYEGKKEADNHV